jgi:ABC-type polysaccharide/polyol phosphate transport system ATPase subunit
MNMLTDSKIKPLSTVPLDKTAVLMEDVSVVYRVPREMVSGIKEYAIRFMQRRLAYEEFWALKGITFDVKRGEVFGVIGRNGSGKSTMLKVMARVLQPTRGRIMTRGRLAPLLELGAGFHPELTGRENVFLNMALLGFTRKESEELLGSIMDFAEIHDFIDAPIRTYSTGMVARLGFSVATSRRPEILLVDEVLSVGDGPFQEKCIERMRSFQSRGTTIIIVSHNMPIIEAFCSRALLLDHGRIVTAGDVRDVISQYTVA